MEMKNGEFNKGGLKSLGRSDSAKEKACKQKRGYCNEKQKK
jgi:hypothetical protein